MFVTMAEMIVIMDTLRGSEGIADHVNIFGYTKNTRSTLHGDLLKRLDNIKIGVKEADDGSSV